MSTVELRFSALPSHVRTARLVAAAMARRSGVDESLLDEVRLAVGEACSRAVALHRRYRPADSVVVRLSDDDGTFRVVVEDLAPESDDTDQGSLDMMDRLGGEGEAIDPLEAFPASVGLAVVTGLVDDVEVEHGPTGSAVRMSWPADPAAAIG